MEQHGAGHGVQVHCGPYVLGARLCVLDNVVGDVVAGLGAQITLEDCGSREERDR